MIPIVCVWVCGAVKVSAPGVCSELTVGKVMGSSLCRDHNYLENYLLLIYYQLLTTSTKHELIWNRNAVSSSGYKVDFLMT